MRTIVLGDIHGRTVWKDILDKEKPDRVVFLGDYVSSHEGIRDRQQINNLLEILEQKEENPERFILLRGNHDMQHLGYYWAECSGVVYEVKKLMSNTEFRERFLADTQWIYELEAEKQKIVCSHAGISQKWMDDCKISTVGEINGMKPSERFAFTPDTPWDYNGDSVTQPCTWIRPPALKASAIAGYTQIVGHTPLKLDMPIALKTDKSGDTFWLCDTLHVPSYLVIEDDKIKPYKLNENFINEENENR